MKKGSVLIVLLISVFLIVGCTSIDNLKTQGEELVCSPTDLKVDDSVSDVTGSAIAGKVTDELKDMPEVDDASETDETNANDVDEAEDADTTDEELAGKTDDVDTAEPIVDDMVVKTFTEGDLVKLSPKATDREQDTVTFKYTSPLGTTGEWLTGPGDAGTYIVTVTASDGKSEVSKKVKLVVVGLNQPPVLVISDSFKVKEGDTITLNPKVSDPEGKKTTVSYSGWMNSNSYTTSFEDAGTHKVTVVGSDGELTTSKTVTIIVDDLNRVPMLSNFADFTVKEGELVSVEAKAIDPDVSDRDKLDYTFSLPLNKNGQWQTAKGDAGTYEVKVTVSDGKDKDDATFLLVVKSANRAPIIMAMADLVGAKSITVAKGETNTVTLTPKVVDEDGDDVVVTYSGWMTSATKTVSQADSGLHDVTITADDGKEKSTMTVKVEVNTPPEFEI